MSLLDIEDRIEDVPEFTIEEIVAQYLNDINGRLNSDIPFTFINNIRNYNGKTYTESINDTDVLVRDLSMMFYYKAEIYTFCDPLFLSRNRNDHFSFVNKMDEIKEQVSPGIYKRVTWGHIKKHFNLK